MKKKLEAELVSIAHRVLKLKNREQTVQLQQEAKNLYERLTVLRFYEENFEAVKTEISTEVLEEKLETFLEEIATETEAKTEIKKEAVITVKEELSEPKIISEIKEVEKSKPQINLFNTISADDYKDLDFVRVDDVPKEVKKVAEKEITFEARKAEIAIEEKPTFIEKEEVKASIENKSTSLNDKLNQGVNFGLNDRIAFEKRLFNGSADDMNRVLSQLNTFESFEEAKGFINSFVKPDYNNWEGKEEFETRFLDLVEKKFT